MGNLNHVQGEWLKHRHKEIRNLTQPTLKEYGFWELSDDQMVTKHKVNKRRVR